MHALGAIAVSRLASVPLRRSSYVDSSVVDGVIYGYRVYAYGDFGESEYFNEVCGTEVPLTLYAHDHPSRPRHRDGLTATRLAAGNLHGRRCLRLDGHPGTLDKCTATNISANAWYKKYA